MTKSIPLLTNDIKKDVVGKLPKDFPFTFDELKFNSRIEVDDQTEKELDDEFVVAQDIFEKVTPLYKKACTDILDVCKKAYKDGKAKPGDREKIAKGMTKMVDKILLDTDASVYEVAEKRIEKWRKDKDDRRKYEIRHGKAVAVCVIGIATSSAGIASAGAGNIVGLISGIYGLLKSIATLAQELKGLYNDIRKAEKEFTSSCDDLAKKYSKEIAALEKQDKAAKGAAKTELLGAILESFTSVKTGISKLESKYDFFNGKYLGMETSSSKYLKVLLELSKEVEKLEAEVDRKKGKEKKAGYVSKQLPKVEKTLAETVKKVDSQLDTMRALYKDLGEYRKKMEKAEKDLDTIKKLKPKGVNELKFALGLLTSAATFAGGGPPSTSDITTFVIDNFTAISEYAVDESGALG